MADTHLERYEARCAECSTFIESGVLPTKAFEDWAMAHAKAKGHRVIIRKKITSGVTVDAWIRVDVIVG